jgi:hypothetical protein
MPAPTGNITSFTPPDGTHEKASTTASVTASANISVPAGAAGSFDFILAIVVGEHGVINRKTLAPGQNSTLTATLVVFFPPAARSIDVTAALEVLNLAGGSAVVLDRKVNNYPIDP